MSSVHAPPKGNRVAAPDGPGNLLRDRSAVNRRVDGRSSLGRLGKPPISLHWRFNKVVVVDKLGHEFFSATFFMTNRMSLARDAALTKASAMPDA
jgi:hypothetical protein